MVETPRGGRSGLRAWLREMPGARRAAAAARWLSSADRREIVRLRRTEPALLQPFTDTFEERYPELFDALAERLKELPEPRILSFGCSSGAEVRALRRRLPHARLTGIDPNRRMIAAARAAEPGHAGDYLQATAPPPAARFDAILALAVFRHGVLEAGLPPSCAEVLPFAQFDRALTALDAVLVPGGYLAIWNAHFRLRDSSVASRYRADPLHLPGLPPQSLLYGPDNQRLNGVCEEAVLFLKRGNPATQSEN